MSVPHRRRGALLAVVALLVTACSAGPSTSTAAPEPPTTVDSGAPLAPDEPPPLLERDPVAWPFAADSPWNTPIGRDVRHLRRSTALTEALVRPDIEAWINAGQFSHPVVSAAATDPLVPIRYESSDVPPFEGVLEIPVPPTAQPAEGTDGHLHVIEPGGRWVDEFFDFEWTERGASAAYWVRNDLRSSGVESGGTRAYGGSAIGGLIRTWEWERGRIDHALALALTNEQLGRGPVWPATLEDGDADATYEGMIPMGTHVSIPLEVDLADLGLSPEGLMVARALQRYGAYVVDRSDSVSFYTEPALEPELERIRRELRVIVDELRIVVNNSRDEPGGPGLRVAPAAPPFTDDEDPQVDSPPRGPS